MLASSSCTPRLGADTVTSRLTRSLLCVGAWSAVASTLLLAMSVVWGLWLNHFTWQAIFFGAWFTAGMSDAFGVSRNAEGVFLLHTAPFTFSILNAIGVLITVLPIMDSGIIAAQSGDTPLGEINLGNIAVHYLPIAVYVTLLTQRAKHVRDAYSRTKATFIHGMDWVPKVSVWLSGVALPLAFGGVYAAWYDFQAEYTVNAEHMIVYLAGLITLVLSTTLLWVFLLVRHIC